MIHDTLTRPTNWHSKTETTSAHQNKNGVIGLEGSKTITNNTGSQEVVGVAVEEKVPEMALETQIDRAIKVEVSKRIKFKTRDNNNR